LIAKKIVEFTIQQEGEKDHGSDIKVCLGVRVGDENIKEQNKEPGDSEKVYGEIEADFSGIQCNRQRLEPRMLSSIY